MTKKTEEKENKAFSETPAKEMENLKHELNEKQKLVEDYIDHLKRLQAEFENYTKRIEKEREEFKKHSTNTLIKRLLTTLDEFESALNACKAMPEVVQGFELVYKNFKKTLEQEGVKEIEAKEKNLDPMLHEVVLQEKTSKQAENTVLEVLQKGYTLHEAVLRPVRVKIAKSEEEDKNNCEKKEND
ncbi:nucleotide exchange factor GrpE [Candidatus Woesearchaeota archaeon]|nr:nucleotide exchange factor GrpE [Candidatus Woesearchaeota archaeon]